MKKELALWLFFLMLCFGAGFLKGNATADLGSSFFGGPTEVEILVTDEMFLPADIRQELEKKLNLQIKISVVHDREEFNIRTITSPGYHLALVPDHWITPANLAHQMSNINPLIPLLSQRISADFLQTSQQKMYGAPIYWMVTQLYQTSGTTVPAPSKKYYLLKDWDELTTKISELHLSADQVQPTEFFKAISELNVGGSVFEISHLDQEASKKLTPGPFAFTSLYVWSLCTPRHSPSRKITLKLIEALTAPELQLKLISRLPIASTLKSLDQESLERSKKSLALRDLDLSHLRKPKSLSLEDLKQFKIDHSAH